MAMYGDCSFRDAQDGVFQFLRGIWIGDPCASGCYFCGVESGEGYLLLSCLHGKAVGMGKSALTVSCVRWTWGARIS